MAIFEAPKHGNNSGPLLGRSESQRLAENCFAQARLGSVGAVGYRPRLRLFGSQRSGSHVPPTRLQHFDIFDEVSQLAACGSLSRFRNSAFLLLAYIGLRVTKEWCPIDLPSLMLFDFLLGRVLTVLI